MRLSICTLLVFVLAGCASTRVAFRDEAPSIDSNRYDDATSAALVFDPPVAAGDPKLELSRDEREPSAFVSFDGPSTTYYWIHTDDLQASEWGGSGARWGGGLSSDRYERRAIIDKTGVTYR